MAIDVARRGSLIYATALQVIRDPRPVVATLQKHDPGLADQMRRSLNSVPLNLAEGSQARWRNRKARYCTAKAEMQEAIACLDVAMANGYVDTVDAEVLERMRAVVRVLIRNVH